MSDIEKRVAEHYDTGAILDRIRAGLERAGVDPERPAPGDLKGVDEFHIGGIEATNHLLEPLSITPEMRVLDIGSGIGGAARHIAETFGAKVIGIDLTPVFVDVARELSKMSGLADRTTFEVGSAYDLPVEAGSIDLAVMLHVGMNLDDKARLMAEVARVLVPGGRFAMYDVMAFGAHPEFPVPWASEAAASHLAEPEVYLEAAAMAGLELVHQENRGDIAQDFFARMQASMAQDGPPPVGLPLLMGEDAGVKVQNMVRAVKAGDIAPVEMVFKAG